MLHILTLWVLAELAAEPLPLERQGVAHILALLLRGALQQQAKRLTERLVVAQRITKYSEAVPLVRAAAAAG